MIPKSDNDRRSELLEAYEEAAFALAMDELMEQEGRDLLEQNEKLLGWKDPDFPEELDARCLRMIDRYYRKKTARRCLKALKKPFLTVCAVFFCLFLAFLVPFTTVSAFRAASLDLVIERFDVGTTIRVQRDSENTDQTTDVFRSPTWFPPGTWTPVVLEEDPLSYMIGFEDENENTIYYYDMSAESSSLNIDTENAEVNEITVNGCKGLSSVKDGQVILAWVDDERSLICDLMVQGSGEIATLENALRIAESIED